MSSLFYKAQVYLSIILVGFFFSTKAGEKALSLMKGPDGLSQNENRMLTNSSLVKQLLQTAARSNDLNKLDIIFDSGQVDRDYLKYIRKELNSSIFNSDLYRICMAVDRYNKKK